MLPPTAPQYNYSKQDNNLIHINTPDSPSCHTTSTDGSFQHWRRASSRQVSIQTCVLNLRLPFGTIRSQRNHWRGSSLSGRIYHQNSAFSLSPLAMVSTIHNTTELALAHQQARACIVTGTHTHTPMLFARLQ
jgi:hypothetical protein